MNLLSCGHEAAGGVHHDERSKPYAVRRRNVKSAAKGLATPDGVVGGFTKRYGCKRLVWYELHSTMVDAITREKQIKGGSRKKKLALIEATNPTWKDLFEEVI